MAQDMKVPTGSTVLSILSAHSTRSLTPQNHTHVQHIAGGQLVYRVR
jgi:hypothetical protein